MMATVDLVGIRPLMQATLAALFKFEMFDGVGDQQQTTPARACFKPIDEWIFRNGFRFLRFLWWMLQSDLNIFRAVAEIKVLDNLAAASAGSVFWPRQADTTKTSDIPAALDMSAQLAPLENFASMIASVISIVLIISMLLPDSDLDSVPEVMRAKRVEFVVHRQARMKEIHLIQTTPLFVMPLAPCLAIRSRLTPTVNTCASLWLLQ
jgi:hypothetical protein